MAPGVAVFLAGQFLISTARIWFARMGVTAGAHFPLDAAPACRRGHFRLRPMAPAIVVGEVHHPVRAIESPAPAWLTIPERGLYTGVVIVGAVGSGKTSAVYAPVRAPALELKHAKSPDRRRVGPGAGQVATMAGIGIARRLRMSMK